MNRDENTIYDYMARLVKEHEPVLKKALQDYGYEKEFIDVALQKYSVTITPELDDSSLSKHIIAMNQEEINAFADSIKLAKVMDHLIKILQEEMLITHDIVDISIQFTTKEGTNHETKEVSG